MSRELEATKLEAIGRFCKDSDCQVYRNSTPDKNLVVYILEKQGLVRSGAISRRANSDKILSLLKNLLREVEADIKNRQTGDT